MISRDSQTFRSADLRRESKNPWQDVRRLVMYKSIAQRGGVEAGPRFAGSCRQS